MKISLLICITSTLISYKQILTTRILLISCYQLMSTLLSPRSTLHGIKNVHGIQTEIKEQIHIHIFTWSERLILQWQTFKKNLIDRNVNSNSQILSSFWCASALPRYHLIKQRRGQWGVKANRHVFLKRRNACIFR